jgi:hypothetical protein
MPADLKNARLKLARAKERLDKLRANVDAYMTPPPYRVATKEEGHERRGYIYVEREPDPSWGLDLGEVAVGARSVLDMLVKQLVIEGGNQPTRSNAFPIFSITTTTQARVAASPFARGCSRASRKSIGV